MTDKKLDELYSFLEDPAFLDIEAEKAMQISKRFTKNKEKIRGDCKSIKLAILSNFNLDFLINTIEFCLFQRGINAEIFTADFGTMFSQLLDEKSKTFQFEPDYILIWPTHRDIQKFKYSSISEASFWSSMWKISNKKNIQIIQILFDFPPFASRKNFIDKKNYSFLDHIKNTNTLLLKKYSEQCEFLRIENLMMHLGTENWHDYRMFHLCKQPFSMDAIPTISQHLASELAGRMGNSKKVLILDLDNTLWGGEIGDVGQEGIVLGRENGEGESYLEFQSYIKALNKNGVILSVCSKNEELLAESVFKNHPEMQIEYNDISCFIANFNDKATNIRKIKEFLNVGYDSMVFIDDNVVECKWVKKQIPEITVINLKGDPSSFAMQVDRLGLFLKGKVTSEDIKRTKSYTTLKKIERVKNNSGELEIFLSSLKPKLIVEEVSPFAIDRIAQLLQKTNQFKLNGFIYSKEEVTKNKKNIIALRFTDKLNDYGIVVVIIAEFFNQTLKIVNWVMSCRVFSRNIEFAVYRILKKIALKYECKNMLIEFHANSKNGPAASAIKKIGFVRKGKTNLFYNDMSHTIKEDNIDFRNLKRIEL